MSNPPPVPHPPPPKKSVIPVADALITKGKQQLKELLVKHKYQLYPNGNSYDPLAQPNVSLAEKTKYSYGQVWKEMMRFYYWIGCYQSAMLVDRELCPMNPLPFKASSFGLYLNFKFGTPNQPLLDENGCQVCSVDGEPIMMLGSVNSPTGLSKVKAATRFIHIIAYPNQCAGPYQVNCPECEALNQDLGTYTHQSFGEPRSALVSQDSLADLEPDELPIVADDLPDADDDDPLLDGLDVALDSDEAVPQAHCGLYRSCPTHANNPLLSCKGYIFNHPPIEHLFLSYCKSKRKTHVVKGCGQLYPGDQSREQRGASINRCDDGILLVAWNSRKRPQNDGGGNFWILWESCATLL